MCWFILFCLLPFVFIFFFLLFCIIYKFLFIFLTLWMCFIFMCACMYIREINFGTCHHPQRWKKGDLLNETCCQFCNFFFFYPALYVSVSIQCLFDLYILSLVVNSLCLFTCIILYQKNIHLHCSLYFIISIFSWEFIQNFKHFIW